MQPEPQLYRFLRGRLARLGGQVGTYTYGQEPVGLATPWQGGTADDLFGTGPALNALEVADHMRYELKGGAKPQGRGQFLPPVGALARQIGLR